jgi:hypothetical protein
LFSFVYLTFSYIYFRVQRYILFPSSAIPKNDGFAEIPKYGDR